MRWFIFALALAPASLVGAQQPPVAQPGPQPSDLVALRADVQSAAAAKVGAIEALPHYGLDLEIAPNGTTFELREIVDFVVPAGRVVREVPLFVYANTSQAKRATPVLLASGSCSERPCHVKEESGGLIRVKLQQSARPGEHVQIELALRGELPVLSAERTTFDGQAMESLTSLLGHAESSDFGLLAYGDGIASLGGFYAVLAPRRKGAWDAKVPKPLGDLTSDELSNVSARIRVPRFMRIATPGVTVGERDLEGLREYDVQAPLVRDFAVLASTNFLTYERSVGDVLVRVSLLPRSSPRAEQVLRAATESLTLFDEVFGRYPYRELDVVEAPLVGGVGGVEFSGLVTIAHMLLAPPAPGGLGSLIEGLSGKLGEALDGAVPSTRDMLDLVVAHEVAHQWWHVLVGSDSRREPFVDEGLAQWSALYFLERQRGTQALQRAEKQVVMSYQMMRAMGEPDRPVNRPVESFGSQLAYAGLVYGKGPLVYRELRREVGDQVFFEALANYVDRYSYTTAPKDAFVSELAARADRQRVTRLARRWLEEAHGDEDLGKLSLGQQLPGGSNPSGLFEQLFGGGRAGNLERALKLLERLMPQNKP